MPWKTVTFAGNNAGAGDRLQAEFSALFVAAGAPGDAVMLGGLDIPARTFHYFFSPSAVRLASRLLDRYGAVDCPEPPKDEYSLLVANLTGRESS